MQSRIILKQPRQHAGVVCAATVVTLAYLLALAADWN